MQQEKEQQQVEQTAHTQPVKTTIPQFNWPTSKPGPKVTQPPPGQKQMPGRTEQVVEVGYNQETGTPSTDSPLRSMPDASLKGKTGFDQQETAQDAMKRRKRR